MNLYVPGIYLIRCIPTGEIYVGSATCIAVRWNTHKFDLRGKKHHNAALQEAWDECGPEAFRVEVLEHVPDYANQKERERFHIRHYQTTMPLRLLNVVRPMRHCKVADQG
jgi:group I intron endonuclease